MNKLKHLIETRKAKAAVIGLGYVGLPLCLAIHDAGFPVIGFDVDPEKIKNLQKGKGYIKHIDQNAVKEMCKSGRFEPTSDPKKLKAADIIILCVPTPLTPQREPDMTYVVKSTETVARVLRKGQLVVLESTSYPGTTDELMREMLDATGLTLGADYFLAFSPEREDPGNKKYTTVDIPKVVGGVDQESGDLAEAFYSAVVKRVVRVADARTAESVKLTENIFRAINIALVNELKVIYDKMGIDVWNVLDAASTKPFGMEPISVGGS